MASGDAALRQDGHRRPRDPRRARPRPGRGHRRASSTCGSTAATITQLGTDVDANGHRVIDGSGLVLAPGVRRPARPPAHARPRGRGDDRDRHRGRRGRRLLRDPRHAEHRPGRRRGRRAARPARACRARGGGAGRLLRGDHEGAAGSRADRDGRARRRGRRRVHRRRAPGRRRRRDAPRAAVQHHHPPRDRRPLRGADAHARRPRARRPGRRRARSRPVAVARREPHGRPRPRARRRGRPADPPDAPLRPRVGRAPALGTRGGRRGDRAR